MKNATELAAMHLQLAAAEQWQNIILGKNDGGKVGLCCEGEKPTPILNRLDADLWCWLQLVPGIRGMTAEMNDIATGI